MRGVFLAIGDELVAGRVANTTSFWAAGLLSRRGYRLLEIVTVPDDREAIVFHLRRLFPQTDFLIASGGLGPTEDDLTSESVAEALGLRLVVHKGILARIRENEKAQGLPVNTLRDRMAHLPEGACPLSEDFTAAGYLLEHQGKPLFFLPGVPSQFRELFEKKVLPYLEEKFPPKETVFTRTLRFFDLREAEINRAVKKILGEGLEVGFYPVFPEVQLTLTARGKDEGEVRRRVLEAAARLQTHFPEHLFGEDQEELAAVLGRILVERGYSLSVAESCTGGLIASLITRIPGSSEYFIGGAVTYANWAKREVLGVPERFLRLFGAVSREVALAMASGARKRFSTTFALSVTGIAGPGGGTPEKPVGTVWLGLSTPTETVARKFLFPGSRHEIQTLAAFTALDWLRRYLLTGNLFPAYRFAVEGD